MKYIKLLIDKYLKFELTCFKIYLNSVIKEHHSDYWSILKEFKRKFRFLLFVIVSTIVYFVLVYFSIKNNWTDWILNFFLKLWYNFFFFLFLTYQCILTLFIMLDNWLTEFADKLYEYYIPLIIDYYNKFSEKLFEEIIKFVIENMSITSNDTPIRNYFKSLFNIWFNSYLKHTLLWNIFFLYCLKILK